MSTFFLFEPPWTRCRYMIDIQIQFVVAESGKMQRSSSRSVKAPLPWNCLLRSTKEEVTGQGRDNRPRNEYFYSDYIKIRRMRKYKNIILEGSFSALSKPVVQKNTHVVACFTFTRVAHFCALLLCVSRWFSRLFHFGFQFEVEIIWMRIWT